MGPFIHLKGPGQSRQQGGHGISPTPVRYSLRTPSIKGILLEDIRMLDRYFGLSKHGTMYAQLAAQTDDVLTMAYIIFVQPAVLSGSMFGEQTGMDFGAVTYHLSFGRMATAIMALYAYPIAKPLEWARTSFRLLRPAGGDA